MDVEKYKRYLDMGWWGSIQNRDIDNWKNNFGNKANIAKVILDNVIYYNRGQLESYTRVLINKLKEKVYAITMEENGYSYIEEDVLNKKWDDFLGETCFLPATSHKDPTASAHGILRYWRNELKITEEAYDSLENIEEKYKKGFRRFILVDDFSGSGEQMAGLLEQKIEFGGQKIEIGNLPEKVKDIEIIIAVYVIYENAKKRLMTEFPVQILYVDYINDHFNFLNKDAVFYGEIDEKSKREIIDDICKFKEDIINDNKKLEKLSQYALNIPIVFEHGCPNNTLLLLFAQSENWQQLFRGGDGI